MKSKLGIIGIDVGYSGVKVATENGETFSFTSHISKDVQRGFADYAAEQKRIVIYQGQEYVVGGEAKKVSYSQDNEFHGSEEWQVLVCGALLDIIKNNGEHPSAEVETLVLGLPISQCDPALGLKGKIESFQKFEFSSDEDNGGKLEYKITIKNVRVVPQCFPLTSMIPLKDVDEDEPIGILDIGYYTLDFAILKDGILPSEYYGSRQLGVHEVYRQLKQLFAAKHSGISLGDDRLRKLLIKGYIVIKGKKVNFNKEIEGIKKKYWEMIFKDLKSQWSDEMLFMGKVYVAGGGAELLSDLFKSDKSDISFHVLDAPLYGNAKGYVAAAKMAMGKN